MLGGYCGAAVVNLFVAGRWQCILAVHTGWPVYMYKPLAHSPPVRNVGCYYQLIFGYRLQGLLRMPATSGWSDLTGHAPWAFQGVLYWCCFSAVRHALLDWLDTCLLLVLGFWRARKELPSAPIGALRPRSFDGALRRLLGAWKSVTLPSVAKLMQG